VKPAPTEAGNGKDKEGNRIIRILVAEDNAINQRLIKRLLEKAGFAVELARDGKEALDTFINLNKAGNLPDKLDLILMDIQMPIMDGMEATRAIKKIDKDIPVIALTAHAMKGDREKFLAAGMDDYISKPIDKAMLFEIIKKYVH
jgi:CheY-like chemotaxis protein